MAGSRVLVLSFDPLTQQMPGPAIRAWHLASVLGEDHEVVLAGTVGADRASEVVDVRSITSGPQLDELVDWCDVVFAPNSVVRRHPAVIQSAKPLCVDLYVPTHLENLEPFGDAGTPEHVAAVEHQVAVLNDDLRHGDFFLCASERQRDFWLGSLASLGRITPKVYGQDPTLRSLIDVVPFGVAPEPAPPKSGALRAAFPAIGPDDEVLIWGGGVYNWFDPLSLVRAVDGLVRSGRRSLRLVFLGMRNPNPGIPEMRMAAALRSLSDELGLTGVHVFFKEGWVPYDERGTYLADADVGVSTHLAHIETHFSFRTRVLDYLWAGLPTVLTGGDTLSEGIAAAGLGVAVPPGDDRAIAAAIEAMLAQRPDRSEVQAYAQRYAWDAVAGPLQSYVAAPGRSAERPQSDLSSSEEAVDLEPAPAEPAPPAPGAPPSPMDVLRRTAARRLPPSVRQRVSAAMGGRRHG